MADQLQLISAGRCLSSYCPLPRTQRRHHMTQDTPKSPRRPRKLGPLTIAALLASGLVQPLLPVFAAGTTAGQQISNTATATYSETSGGPTIDATSNTVTVTVAEVAGLTAVPAGFDDLDGGAVEAGDILQFNFDVTNVGNSATDVFFPGENNLTTENFDIDTVEILNSAGTVIAIVPADGGSLLGGPGINLLDPANPANPITLSELAVDGVLTLRVTGTPAAGTSAGADVGVTVGSTGPDNNSPTTQNQPDSTDGSNPNEIRTINFDDPAITGTDTPVNGEREASAENSIPFASSVRPLALATVTKIASNLAPGATAAANDDLITYDLGLTVASTSPNAAFTPADLEGTNISVNGTVAPQILVSDAIPVGTELSAAGTAPAGWTVVYTETATTTTATNALWTTAVPAGGLEDVTRIGFIHNDAALSDTNPQVLRTDPVQGPFQFTVVTVDLPTTGGQVANIAQVFGETVGDPDDNVVYDESGDSNPNNFNDDGTPPDPTGTNYDPTANTGDTGIADPVTQGTDTGNDNTGTGPDGEDNVVNIGDVAGSDDILNGPEDIPGAVGPTDDNDDFTNQTTDVPAGVGPTDIFDPAPETFINSIQNPASSGFISNVTLQPISPTQAESTDDSALTGQYGANSDIPTGTVVTITATDDAGVVQSATYTYNGTTFDLTGSSTNGTPETAGNFKHVNVGDLNAGAPPLDYTTVVDLPDGSAAGTADDVFPNDEIPIPILAFADDNPSGSPGYNFASGTPESTTNITLDRLYTGFMKLTKEVQILDANGVLVQAWTSDQTVLDNLNNNPATALQPDYQIEYRITYENISTDVVGSGNTTLTAFDFEIVEDGNPVVNAGTDEQNVNNNWASFTDHEQNTSADQGTVEYFTNSTDGSPLTTADPIAGTKVDKYENPVGQVDPGQTGQFQFRRRIQ